MEKVSFNKWHDFRAYVDSNPNIFYWRGQNNPEWPLASSFERIILGLNGGWHKGASQIYPYDGRFERNGKKIWQGRFYEELRDGYFHRFFEAASGLRGTNPSPLKTDQWWALGRHYGLVTPLLDWTTKPYIAAFFALTDLYSQMKRPPGIVFDGKQIAIYRLFHNGQLEGNGLKIVKPVVEELGRLHGQRGLFTWLDSEKYFELQGFLDNNGKGDLLTQIILPDQVILDGLADLDRHGIDYRLLFPDLIGAALHANAQANLSFP